MLGGGLSGGLDREACVKRESSVKKLKQRKHRATYGTMVRVLRTVEILDFI